MADIAKKHKTVLLVDDHVSNLNTFGMMLQGAGYDVRTITVNDFQDMAMFKNHLLRPADLSSGKFWNALKEEIRGADIIVSDYNLSDTLTGVDFIEQVRRLPGCDNKPIFIHSRNPNALRDDAAQMQRAAALGITPDLIFEKSTSQMAPRVDAMLQAYEQTKQVG